MSGEVDNVQEVIDRVDAIADPIARSLAQDAVAAVMEMYGAGLERIGAILADCGEAGDSVRTALLADGIVASLLLIHDLYPVDLETRVLEALDSVRPYMESHGGSVEFLGLTEAGVAQLRLQGSCKTCKASSVTLELAIKQALDERAPDLAGLEVVGGEPAPLAITQRGPGTGWHALNGAGTIEEGELAAASVAGMEIVIANVDGSLLAYKDACSACGAALHAGSLQGSELTCGGCGQRYNLVRAGKAPDADVQLRPVPLLGEGANARVAV